MREQEKKRAKEAKFNTRTKCDICDDAFELQGNKLVLGDLFLEIWVCKDCGQVKFMEKR